MARDARAAGVDWAHIRSQFPATRDQAYLDCATYGPCPLSVHERFSAASRLWLEGRGVWLDDDLFVLVTNDARDLGDGPPVKALL